MPADGQGSACRQMPHPMDQLSMPPASLPASLGRKYEEGQKSLASPTFNQVQLSNSLSEAMAGKGEEVGFFGGEVNYFL